MPDRPPSPSPGPSPEPDDVVAGRLAALARSLQDRFGDDVVAEDGVVLRLRPPEGACAVSWFAGPAEVVLGVGTGGRWELPRDETGVAFLEDVVESVVAGRAVELLAPGRAALAVTLADGRVERTEVRGVPGGCLPLSRWRSGPVRHVTYRPYG